MNLIFFSWNQTLRIANHWDPKGTCKNDYFMMKAFSYGSSWCWISCFPLLLPFLELIQVLTKISNSKNEYYLVASINYVDRILRIFDPSPLLVNVVYGCPPWKISRKTSIKPLKDWILNFFVKSDICSNDYDFEMKNR